MNDDWIARVVGRVVFAVRQLTRHDASAHRVELLFGGDGIDRVVLESAAPIQVSVTVVKRREPEEPLPGWPKAKFTAQMKPEDNEEIRVLLIKLWTRDSYGPDYNKAEWMRLANTLTKFGYRL